jgi:hypothetical protein
MSDTKKRRVGVVHAISNAGATLLYLMSWRARHRGHHGAGVIFGMLGATAATVGGYLGGHLAFGESGGDEPDTAVSEPAPREPISATV